MRNSLSNENKEILQELSERAAALKDLDGFRRYMARSHHSDFAHPPAPHHRLLQNGLMELMSSPDVDGLIIEMPPGSAKSTYASVQFPCWYLAQNPDHKIVAISNTTALAEDFSRRRRSACLEEDWQLLAGTDIPKDHQALANFGTSRGGSMLAVGMGSAVSGRRANLLIIDDPIVGIEQANSMAQLEKQWDSYNYEYRNRLVPGGKQVIISTRWSQWDVIGRIKKSIAEGTEKRKWKILTIPMEARKDDPLGRTPGERLWPEWFTEEMVAENKSDPLRWGALYQQEPIDASGTWVEAQHIRIVRNTEVPTNLSYITAVDLALSQGTGDDTAIVTAGLSPQRDLYIIDVHLDKVVPSRTLAKLSAVCAQYDPSVVLIEDSPAEKVFIETAREYSRNGGELFYLRPMPTRGRDKETRAAAIRDLFMQGRVYLVEGQWNAEVMKQILNFPPKSRSVHDDFIDAIALIGRHIGRQGCQQPQTNNNSETYIGALQLCSDGKTYTRSTLNEMFEDELCLTSIRKIARI